MSTAQMPLLDVPLPALAQVERYPHMRYMGSKYRLLPTLADVFQQVGGKTAMDPFSGSGVVSCLLKAQGYSVTSGDYLNFPVTLTKAACVNQSQRLTGADVAHIVEGGNADGRDFIDRTYKGLFFTADDLRFLDAAWSQIDRLQGSKRHLAIASLVLAAARKQPRGVFTVTGLLYDDGRASLHMPLAEQFVRCVEAWNGAVFEGERCRAVQGDVSRAKAGADLVYLDPPYAPPRDDNDYLKRYWFLEGLATYWDNGTAAVMKVVVCFPHLRQRLLYLHGGAGVLLDEFHAFGEVEEGAEGGEGVVAGGLGHAALDERLEEELLNIGNGDEVDGLVEVGEHMRLEVALVAVLACLVLVACNFEPLREVVRQCRHPHGAGRAATDELGL